MAPVWGIVFALLWVALFFVFGRKINSIILHFFSLKVPKKILSVFLTVDIYMLIILGIPYVVINFINKDIYNLDRVRHVITDRRHPISQEEIFRVLNFDYEQSDKSQAEIERMVHSLGEAWANNPLDSLIDVLNESPNFDNCLSVYRTTLKLTIPDDIKNYYLSKAFQLAETKYETLRAILHTSYYRKDLDTVLSVYELVKEWRWDRNWFDASTKKDTHEADRNYTIASCMSYAIRLLENSPEQINDSIAQVIFDYTFIGADAAIDLFSEGSFDPHTFFFFDKRAQYAYRLNDPKADKYADYYIERTKRTSFFANHYHYIINDRGSDIEGYQNRFFSDPLFLRYKSCLKQKKYKKARDLLSIVQSETTDDYQDPFNPYYQLHDSIQFANRRVLDIALPYAQYDLATISENARLRFLTHDEDFEKWANGSYLTGAWYLSPTEGLMHKTIDCLFEQNVIPANKLSQYIVVNYNNSDPRWVYNTALYLKGATTKISGAIERAIRNSDKRNLVDDLKAIKREHVFSSVLDTADQRYTDLNDSVEVLLGPRMKEALSECFYSFVDIKNGLSDNECAIEIVKAPSLSFGEDTYKAVVLRNDWDEPRTITLAKSGELNESIISGNYYSDVSYLYYSIWKPLEKYVAPQDIIYLAPDGVLSLISFSSLVNDRGQHLSDIYDIRTCVSTKSVMDKHEGEHQESIALFGGMNYDGSTSERVSSLSGVTAYRSTSTSYRDRAFTYLAGSEREVEVIKQEADKCQMPSRLFVGEGGTEYNFKDLTGKDISIIHVATHGFYYNAPSTRDLTFFEKISVEDNPLNRCGLIFSGGNKAWKGEAIPDNQEDGILLGSEIARMDLSGTDLVVLSACNTGLGDISEEGIEGLQMAFKKAGVKSLLMTLAKVDDEATSYFMTTFYENLFSGKDKHTSFKEAVNTMRSSKRFSDPKYWSPFILID